MDYSTLYPEEPSQLQPMIHQLRVDLDNLAKLDDSPERNQLRGQLSKKLDFIKIHATEDIPARKAKKKKSWLIFILIIIVLLILLCLCLLITSVIGSMNKAGESTIVPVANVMNNIALNRALIVIDDFKVIGLRCWLASADNYRGLPAANVIIFKQESITHE